MSTPELTPDAQRLLESIVVGETPADASDVLELANRDAVFRTRLAELKEVTALLHGVSTAERETRHLAESMRPAPGEDLLPNAVGLPAGSAHSKPRWPWMLAVAAGLIATAFVLRPPAESHEQERIQLGHTLELDAPDAGVLEWSFSGKLPPGGEYLVTISAPPGSQPTDAQPLTFRTTNTRWVFSPDEREQLPPEMWINVKIMGPGSSVIAESSLLYAP